MFQVRISTLVIRQRTTCGNLNTAHTMASPARFKLIIPNTDSRILALPCPRPSILTKILDDERSIFLVICSPSSFQRITPLCMSRSIIALLNEASGKVSTTYSLVPSPRQCHLPQSIYAHILKDPIQILCISNLERWVSFYQSFIL